MTSDTDATADGEVLVVTVSEVALAKILEIRSGEDDPTTLGLRIEVTGIHGVEYAYDLSFETVSEADADDMVYEVNGLTVMIPADSVDALRGSTLDLPTNPTRAGSSFATPTVPIRSPAPAPSSSPATSPSRSAAARAAHQSALRAHGGFATLVGVDGESSTSAWAAAARAAR